MEGTVIKTTGSWYEVRAKDDTIFRCRLKGKFKTKGLKITNPIAVGDLVKVSFESDQESGVIYEILPRRNYLIRTSLKHPEIGHILASNLDQAILIATLSNPKTSLGFIDRFLVSTETFRIPAIIVINKMDIYTESQLSMVEQLQSQYRLIGYTTISTSFSKKEGLEDLLKLLSGKTSLMSGHSGVGKSTLLNILVPEAEQKINSISEFSSKGVHTTTFAEMFQVSTDTYLIDTPGIKELGLMEVGEEELSHYFPEMRALMGQCKFYNCSHVHEPKCAVIDAINHTIPESRYLSYLSMLENHDNRR